MNQSEKLFKEARKRIPGGVNSPVRAFGAVGRTPKFIARSRGPWIWDVDGNRYLDFVMSWGPLILGHANPDVIKAVKRALPLGTSYGAPTENEIRLAALIQSAFPSIEKVRLVSSGTEAVMSAIRLARGATGRKLILKCDGCYHGHADSLLIRAGSGIAQFGIPGSKGVPEELAKLTLSIPFNDEEALEAVIKKYGRDIACFILEPVPANMGVVLPKSGYLQKARDLTKRCGSLLIFDEVVSGFRLAFGGAQELFGVQADLTCLGKILGSGFPIGAFGGRLSVMNELAPEGEVYQAGTLSGNPIAVCAGIETLKKLKERAIYRTLQKRTDDFLSILKMEIKRKSIQVTVNQAGSAFTLFFNQAPVFDYASAKLSDTKRYARFFHTLLENGIYFTPSQFEANFISFAHEPGLLKRAARVILKGLLEN